MILSFVTAKNEILLSAGKRSHETQFGLGLWHVSLICLELGLFITSTGYKFLVKLFKIFFVVLGFAIMVNGFLVMNRRRLIQNEGVDPLLVKKTANLKIPRMDAMYLNFFGLIANFAAIVVISGLSKKCDYEKEEKYFKSFNIFSSKIFSTSTSVKKAQNDIWSFNFYSRWVFKCLLISVMLRSATIFSTVMIRIFKSTIPDIYMTIFLMVSLFLLSIAVFDYFTESYRICENKEKITGNVIITNKSHEVSPKNLV